MEIILTVVIIVLIIAVLGLLVWLIISNSANAEKMAGQNASISLLQQQLDGLKTTQEDTKEKLQKLMETEKLHLDSNLTLPLLAKKTAVSVHHLSQVINEKLSQNFFEFVNSYRVEEAKQMLLDPDRKHLNISAIGFEAGFNSNSSFNSVFKKLTGMTPSQFRNSA